MIISHILAVTSPRSYCRITSALRHLVAAPTRALQPFGLLHFLSFLFIAFDQNASTKLARYERKERSEFGGASAFLSSKYMQEFLGAYVLGPVITYLSPSSSPV